jgi:hypothetical protein
VSTGRRHAVQGSRPQPRASSTWAECIGLLEGYQLADIIPTFGSVNMIGGECDR